MNEFSFIHIRPDIRMEVVAVRGVFEGQKSFCCSAEGTTALCAPKAVRFG